MIQYQKNVGNTQINYPGICSLCNIAATCVYPRDPVRPLLFCDEFDCSSTHSNCTFQKAAAVKSPARAQKSETGSGEKLQEKQLGLCRLCDNRHACTFPKTPAGVWHCEEYL